MALVASINGFLLRQVERANPMLVRRVRQDLRNLAFIGAFVLMLVVATGAAVIFASMADASEGTGRGMFAAVASAWTALMCIQGVATQRAIAGDRTAAAWDLLDLTGLPPLHIVIGVVQANLVLGMLGAAGLAPFLVLAYLLRGIDLPTILFALATLPMLGAALGAIGAFAGSLGANRQSRAGLGFITILALLVGWILLTIFWANSDDTVSPWMAGVTGGERWALVGLLGLVDGWAVLLLLAFTFAAALLTHRALDRSTWPRLAWFAAWANGLAWCVGSVAWMAVGQNASDAWDFAERLVPVVSALAVSAALVMGLFAVSEDHEITPRQQRSLGEGGRVMRLVRSLVGPGAARGARATLLMLVPSLAIAVPWFGRAGLAIAIASYGLVVLAVGDIVARRLFGRLCATPPARRMCTIAILVVAGVVPPIVAQVAREDWIFALSPLWGPAMMAESVHDAEIMGMLPVVMGAGLVALAWMALRATGRTHGLARVTARDTDANPRG